MPNGCFTILIPLDSDYKVLGYYFKEDREDFKITSDLFLRLNLDHSKNEYNLLKLKDFTTFTYYHPLSGKLKRKASGMILGLLLNEEDKPEKFRSSLKEAALELENLDLLIITQSDFEAKLKKIYQEDLEPIVDIMQPGLLKERIINTTKSMLSGGKKERSKAQNLLEKIEDGVHEKIIEFYNAAEKSLKQKDFDKATKLYEKSAEIAKDLMEEDLAKSLIEKAQISKKIPDLLKKRDKFIQEARNSLRNEDFHSAYLYYKKASDLSKDLLDFEKEEEYRLKSKALQEFFQVDEKYKSK